MIRISSVQFSHSNGGISGSKDTLVLARRSVFNGRTPSPYMMRLVLLLLCAMLSACAANFPHPMHTAVPSIAVGRPLAVRVVIRDSRTIVPTVGIARAASCVGQINPLMGETIPIYTASGKSLASDIGNAMCEAFTGQHWPCEALESSFTGTVKEELPRILQGPPVDRIVYLMISEFISQIDTRTQLTYDFDLTVWNGIGSFLASTGEQGTRTLELDTFFNPAENAAQVAPRTLQEILSSLLSAPPVRQSLNP